MNLLQDNKLLMVAEGLDLFEMPVPAELVGRTIAESSIRERTGCSVVAVRAEGRIEVMLDPTATLDERTEIVLIGTNEAEQRFLDIFGAGRK